MDGCIVIRGSHHEKSAIINAQRKQSPRNSRTEGRGMFDRSREETFMLLNFRQAIQRPALITLSRALLYIRIK